MVDSIEPARLAVLIDAENAPLRAIEPLLTDIARYGKAQIKRAYGDWSAGSLRSWKKTLLELSIRPVQVFAAVKGKNAADLVLAIDAMDLLHSGSVSGICLMSSDSDFTRLAERIREGGLVVFGLGEKQKTNPGLPAACDTFVFVETLAAAALPTSTATPDQALVPAQASPSAQLRSGAASVSETSGSSPAAEYRGPLPLPHRRRRRRPPRPHFPAGQRPLELCADTALVSRLREAATMNPGPDGWTRLAAVGSAIRSHPAIVLKTYGYRRLKDLMVTTDLFELRQDGPGRSSAVHSRIK